MEQHVIIGAGPAGLTAAWQLAKFGRTSLVLEADPTYVGGIARTVEYEGNRFDMGGHRFYSKSEEINRMWHEMLPGEFIEVKRLSRIYYDKKFFPYPIELWPTLSLLGFASSAKIAASYLKAQLLPRRPERSFEDWIINRFGQRLYATFFKTYTEKIWGIPCSSIDKDWAAQRIRGLSLLGAVKEALFRPRGEQAIKSLIKTFVYPRLGPGQLWESVRDQVTAKGTRVLHDKRVERIEHAEGLVTSVQTVDGEVYRGTHFYSTMTLKDLVNALDPPPPPEVLRAGNALDYRDFLTVALIIDKPEVFADNWIYIHDPGVHVGRIQNYKNWSVDMVADPTKTCLGMEYFCSRGHELWEMSDDALLKLAAEDVEAIGLAEASDCIDGCIVRTLNAYPVYDRAYKGHRETLKRWLNGYFKNLYPAGRGALHNYNSQDHSMMMAILSIRNMREEGAYDVWSINTESEYAEEGGTSRESEDRLVPRPLSPSE